MPPKDLRADPNIAVLSTKEQVEVKLAHLLPAGSYTVLRRNYSSGDSRNYQEKHQSYELLILLRRAGRETALQKRTDLEALGFQVSASGEISLN